MYQASLRIQWTFDVDKDTALCRKGRDNLLEIRKNHQIRGVSFKDLEVSSHGWTSPKQNIVYGCFNDNSLSLLTDVLQFPNVSIFTGYASQNKYTIRQLRGNLHISTIIVCPWTCACMCDCVELHHGCWIRCPSRLLSRGQRALDASKHLLNGAKSVRV